MILRYYSHGFVVVVAYSTGDEATVAKVTGNYVTLKDTEGLDVDLTRAQLLEIANAMPKTENKRQYNGMNNRLKYCAIALSCFALVIAFGFPDAKADQFSALQAELEANQAASTAQKTDDTCPLYLCMAMPSLLHSNDTCQDGLDGMIDRAKYNVEHFWKPIPLIEDYKNCLDVSTPDADPDAQRMERGRFHFVQIADDDPLKAQGYFMEPDWCDELPRFDSVVKAGDCIMNVNTYTLYLDGVKLGDTVIMDEAAGSTFQWTINDETLIITPIAKIGQ